MRKTQACIRSAVAGLVVLFMSCTTSYKCNEDFSVTGNLERNEGIVVFRIFNGTAGQTLPLVDSGGRAVRKNFLELNSDIELLRQGTADYLVRNDTAPEQLVCISLYKGTWYVVQVGRDSQYWQPVCFTVEPGKINYAGDFYLSLVEGGVPLFSRPKDWYTIEVRDGFSGAMEELLALYPGYTGYEVRNSVNETDVLFPKWCNIRTEEAE